MSSRSAVQFLGKTIRHLPEYRTAKAVKVFKLTWSTVALRADGSIWFSNSKFFKHAMTPRGELGWAELAEALYKLGVLTAKEYAAFEDRVEANTIAQNYKDASERIIADAKEIGLDLTKAQRKYLKVMPGIVRRTAAKV